MQLDALLRQQAGVVTTVEAHACGLSEHAVHRRVRSGAWRRIGTGVHLVGGHPYTYEVRVRAALAAAGAGATAHGLTAAWWHRITDRAPDVVEVTVPRARCLQAVPGTRVRRRDLHRDDIC